METIDDLVKECYLMAKENHIANIQILKNQKQILQNTSKSLIPPIGSTSDAMLIDQTIDILSILTER